MSPVRQHASPNPPINTSPKVIVSPKLLPQSRPSSKGSVSSATEDSKSGKDEDLTIVIAQIEQFAKGDYAAEAKTWEGMRTHMFTIADALADALAKQFPAKF